MLICVLEYLTETLTIMNLLNGKMKTKKNVKDFINYKAPGIPYKKQTCGTAPTLPKSAGELMEPNASGARFFCPKDDERPTRHEVTISE